MGYWTGLHGILDRTTGKVARKVSMQGATAEHIWVTGQDYMDRWTGLQGGFPGIR